MSLITLRFTLSSTSDTTSDSRKVQYDHTCRSLEEWVQAGCVTPARYPFTSVPFAIQSSGSELENLDPTPKGLTKLLGTPTADLGLSEKFPGDIMKNIILHLDLKVGGPPAAFDRHKYSHCFAIRMCKPGSDKWNKSGSTSVADGKEILAKHSQYGCRRASSFGGPIVSSIGGVPFRMDPRHDTFQAVDADIWRSIMPSSVMNTQAPVSVTSNGADIRKYFRETANSLPMTTARNKRSPIKEMQNLYAKMKEYRPLIEFGDVIFPTDRLGDIIHKGNRGALEE
ncbi:hypothetical protein FANTH_7759 [Fusarium anthophilum]|uniref:Uncharacterized protein n=1 Tax=Fusarium anthophilum TaxID=48485 RepID=A0A8H4ZDG2_9HYPO|nr:hypothetical protein FANTH_7759 [Fusarium anthophilum]